MSSNGNRKGNLSKILFCCRKIRHRHPNDHQEELRHDADELDLVQRAAARDRRQPVQSEGAIQDGPVDVAHQAEDRGSAGAAGES